MDEITPPDKNEINAGNPLMNRGEEDVRPVVWTPEDASRFLSAAIHEAQKPLADALKRRPATTSTLVLIVAVLAIAAAAIGWILSHQLSKSEASAETARAARDSAVEQQYELRSKSDALESRLAAAREEQERLSQEYLKENESLRGQAEGKRDSEEELRKARSELTRYRRQNELLKSQISGLEMEKLALSRQLDAVKAMAIDENPEDYAASAEAPLPDPDPMAAPDPEGTARQEPPAENPEPTSSALPTEESPESDVRDDAVPAGEAQSPKTAAVRMTISDSPAAPAPDGTVTVESVPENEKATGTLTLGANGRNPPTLYESSTMMNETAAGGPVQVTSAGAPIPEPEAVSEEKTPEPAKTPERTDAEAPESTAPGENGETARSEENGGQP